MKKSTFILGNLLGTKKISSQLVQTVASFMLLMAMLVMNSATAQAESFKWIKTEKNIQLFERYFMHYGENVREVKATFQVQSTPQEVIALLKDESKIKSWNKRIEKFSITQKEKSSWVAYTQFHLPWPMDNQETLLKYVVNETIPGKKWVIAFCSVTSNQYPIDENITRVKHVIGQWVIEQQNNHTQKISYNIASERNGNIPKAISDPIVRDNLINSMSQLKKTLEN